MKAAYVVLRDTLSGFIPVSRKKHHILVKTKKEKAESTFMHECEPQNLPLTQTWENVNLLFCKLINAFWSEREGQRNSVHFVLSLCMCIAVASRIFRWRAGSHCTRCSISSEQTPRLSSPGQVCVSYK